LYSGLGLRTTWPVFLSMSVTVGTRCMPATATSGSTPIASSSRPIASLLMLGRIVVQNSRFGCDSASPYSDRPTRFFSARVTAASRCISTCARMLSALRVLPVARLLAGPRTLKPVPIGCAWRPDPPPP
jgi:hypothetical protein